MRARKGAEVAASRLAAAGTGPTAGEGAVVG